MSDPCVRVVGGFNEMRYLDHACEIVFILRTRANLMKNFALVSSPTIKTVALMRQCIFLV